MTQSRGRTAWHRRPTDHSISAIAKRARSGACCIAAANRQRYQRMNDRAKRALGLVSVPTLVIGVILLASGTPVQVVAEVLFAMFAVFVTCAFIITRFTSDREPVDIEKPSTLGKSHCLLYTS